MKNLLHLTKKKILLYSFVLTLLGINSWSINHIVGHTNSKIAVKGIQTSNVAKLSTKPTTTPSTTPTAIVKSNNPTPTKIPDTNTTQSNNNSSNSLNKSTTATSENINQNIPTVSPISNAAPTVTVVMHPGGMDGVTSQTGGVQTVYVTPTPNVGTYEASFSYDSSNGKATVIANKPYKACEGVQKDPESNLQLSGINGTTRWACIDGKCGYVCDLYFAPPNTPHYEWPYGVKVTSEQDEVKTFGNW